MPESPHAIYINWGLKGGGEYLHHNDNNLKMTLAHEKRHRDSFLKGEDGYNGYGEFYGHIRVHYDSIKDNLKTWNNTTKEYRKYSARVLVGYLDDIINLHMDDIGRVNPEDFEKSDFYKNLMNAKEWMKSIEAVFEGEEINYLRERINLDVEHYKKSNESMWNEAVENEQRKNKEKNSDDKQSGGGSGGGGSGGW